ncbi:MAG: Acyl-CoA dehydrogenase type 2 domain protein [Ilumatobacteraceae bacterium]|nr:Acyl-CoA dehydrogenase type 2 domain protein [Ilumatobacteraceae bacterium]
MTPPTLPGLDAALDLIASRAAEHDADGSFPFEAFDALEPTGALRLTVPADAGGLGGGLAAATRLVVALGEADPAVALPVSQHLMVHADLGPGWPDGLLRRVRQSAVDGVALINILRVEPELGTPGRGGLPATVAHRLPDQRGWSISGRKIYSTGIPVLRWLLVWAATDDHEPLHGTFVVEAGTPGYTIERTWDALGMRATRSDDVVLDGVEIPLDHALGLAGQMRTTPTAQVWNTAMVAAVYHGVARSARDWLVGYLHERVPSNLGAPLSSLPRFQTEVGRIEALLGISDTLLANVGAAFDAGQDDVAGQAALAKHTVTNHALEVVLAAVSLVGNPGLMRRNPLERHLRNVMHGRIHSPQDDVILLNAGRSALAAVAPIASAPG